MKPIALIAALFALPSFAGSLSVGEIRSKDDTAALAETVRDVARRTLPDARVLDGAEQGGDLQVSGDVLNTEQGLLVTLELREAQSKKLGATASARASTPEELHDAVASAAVDLFRAYKETAALAMAPSPVPEPPGPATALQPAGVVSLDLDANLLVAFDEARAADARGKDRPDEAAAAWRAVAEARAPNPFRDAAAARAGEWQSWAENKRAFDEQRARDTARMRKVLPLAAVTDETKVELLTRYTRAYGIDKASLLVAVLPMPLKARAGLAVGCQAKQAMQCVALAYQADAQNDKAQAAAYYEKACGAGDARSCTEAGTRFLVAPTRDVTRAIPALESGCAAGAASSCARLARVYEEGDGADIDLEQAAQMRDRACAAGDGASCRKLACNASDTKTAADLWGKGCKAGDTLSCTLADAASIPAPAAVPAPAPAAVPAPAPIAPAVVAHNDHSKAAAGLITVGVIAGAGALWLSSQDDHSFRDRPWGRSGALQMADRGSAADARKALPLALGAAAVLSGVAGVGLLFWHGDKADVAVTPTGLAITGKLP